MPSSDKAGADLIAELQKSLEGLSLGSGIQNPARSDNNVDEFDKEDLILKTSDQARLELVERYIYAEDDEYSKEIKRLREAEGAMEEDPNFKFGEFLEEADDEEGEFEYFEDQIQKSGGNLSESIPDIDGSIMGQQPLSELDFQLLERSQSSK